MSSWLVTHTHIDHLVAVNRYGPDGCTVERWEPLEAPGRRPAGLGPDDAIGRMLWAENLKSVAYRYRDDVSGERPGPSGLTDAGIRAYRFLPPERRLSTLAALCALRSLDYQSSDHDGWDTSAARTWVLGLLTKLEGLLPGRQRSYDVYRRLAGYEPASWTIDDPVGSDPNDPRQARLPGGRVVQPDVVLQVFPPGTTGGAILGMEEPTDG